jgi:hypothetical protein
MQNNPEDRCTFVVKKAGVWEPGLGEEGGEGDAGGQRLLVVEGAVQS